MPALSDYTAGTITLTNGSVNFTGAGTGWIAADFREGDTILGIEDHAGVEYVIASITGNGAGTLTQEWEGATGTYNYRMRYMADGARVTAQARNLIELLGNGNLQAEAGIDGTGGNWLSYFTGAGAKARTAFGAAARSLLGLTAAANKMPYYTDLNTAALTDLTAKGRAILSKADNAGVLTEIGAQPAGNYQSALGYTPVNKAGDTGVGNLSGGGTLNFPVYFSGDYTNNGAFTIRAPRPGTSVGQSNFTGALSGIIGNPSLEFALFGVERVGVEMIASIKVSGGGTSTYFEFVQNGALRVPGALSKGSGTFLIDHPLDPLNKDLAHGFVEAPRYDLIYRGVVQLSEGRATVDIDAASNMTEGTFDALTINAVVTSLQNQDGFARLRSGEIAGGEFEIICEDDTCTDHVSWVVIAERNDAFVKSDLDPNTNSDGRFVPERDKPE